MRRLNVHQMLDSGFSQVDSMQCHQRGGVVVSYGLIVAIGNTSAVGYHDYSTTTAKQVTRATGVCTADRRKHWNIVSESDFLKLCEGVVL